MRFYVPGLLGLGLVSAVGCGNSSNKNPDAKMADAAKKIDAPADAPFFKQYNANEGGEVRMEYLNFATGNPSLRVTAYNYKTAGTVPFFAMPDFANGGCFNGDAAACDAAGNCTAATHWPNAQNPTSTRIYEDPGFGNGGVVISGGPTAFTALADTAGTTADPAGGSAVGFFDGVHRFHPNGHASFYFKGSGATDVPASTYATPETAYTVTFPGSKASLDPGGAAIPAQVFPDVMWMPNNYTLLSPPAGSVAITANTDFVQTWTEPTDMNPADHQMFALVGFTGPQGLSTICVFPDNTPAGQTATLTVPAAAINDVIAKYPNGGTMARQRLTHVTRELVDANGPTGNRIDFLTVWCNAGPFTVTGG